MKKEIVFEKFFLRLSSRLWVFAWKDFPCPVRTTSLSILVVSALILLVQLSIAKPCVAAEKEMGIQLYNQGKYLESIEPLKKMASAGSLEASLALKEIYRGNKGIAKDLAEYVRWTKKSADLGDMESQELVARMNDISPVSAMKLWGVKPDESEAIKYYKLAAAQGSTLAMNNLTVILRDPVEILKYLRLGAESGDSWAQFGLGWRYSKGEGVEKNYREAFKWTEKAARQGHEGAQGNLSYFYLTGQGVPQSYFMTYVWGSIGASSGDDASLTNRDVAAKYLNPQMMFEAQKLAAQCQNSSYKNCN